MISFCSRNAHHAQNIRNEHNNLFKWFVRRQVRMIAVRKRYAEAKLCAVVSVLWNSYSAHSKWVRALDDVEPLILEWTERRGNGMDLQF